MARFLLYYKYLHSFLFQPKFKNYVKLSKIRHIRNHAPYHVEGKRPGPITSALMNILISKSKINAGP